MTNNNPKIVFKFAVFHTFSTVKKGATPFFMIFDNGDIGVGKQTSIFRSNAVKLKYRVANPDVTHIETTTTPAGKPETTIKVVDKNGRTDIFRVTQIMSLRKDLVAAQLPPILSTYFSERYTKI